MKEGILMDKVFTGTLRAFVGDIHLEKESEKNRDHGHKGTDDLLWITRNNFTLF